MQPLFICLTLGRRGWGSLVMQMAVCLWHPVIMLYLCPMAAIHGLIQRSVFKLVRYSSFSTILLSQMTQCGASGIAARSIGHCSALHRPLQCGASFGALSCTDRGTPPSSLFQKTENKNAARWDTPHSIVCLTLLSYLPSLLKPMRGRRVFRSDLFTTAPAFLRVSFPIPGGLPWAASSMLLPHPLEQGV